LIAGRGKYRFGPSSVRSSTSSEYVGTMLAC
jgi:hypothetical protein